MTLFLAENDYLQTGLPLEERVQVSVIPPRPFLIWPGPAPRMVTTQSPVVGTAGKVMVLLMSDFLSRTTFGDVPHETMAPVNSTASVNFKTKGALGPVGAAGASGSGSAAGGGLGAGLGAGLPFVGLGLGFGLGDGFGFGRGFGFGAVVWGTGDGEGVFAPCVPVSKVPGFSSKFCGVVEGPEAVAGSSSDR